MENTEANVVAENNEEVKIPAVESTDEAVAETTVEESSTLEETTPAETTTESE